MLPLLAEGEELLESPSSLPASVAVRNLSPGKFHRLRVSLMNGAGRKDVELEFATLTLEGGKTKKLIEKRV